MNPVQRHRSEPSRHLLRRNKPYGVTPTIPQAAWARRPFAVIALRGTRDFYRGVHGATCLGQGEAVAFSLP